MKRGGDMENTKQSRDTGKSPEKVLNITVIQAALKKINRPQIQQKKNCMTTI